MNFKEAELKAGSIVSKMTAEEKLSQLLYNSPAIDRLGIKEYNWWNEASHGVARAGIATVFPHAIGLGATFDPELIREVGDAVSTEGRAKYNKSIRFGDRDIYKGLTYWSPNINIFRDPRWGRGQETFGEDPYLTAVLGAEYIKGIQGDGEFLRAAACAKHFAAHSGPEKARHGFDAIVSEKDLQETYLPAFKYAVDAGVAGVMGAYNRINGEPACCGERLIKEILRGQWGFKGYFVSDCGAISDISEHHHYAEDLKEAAAISLKAGCNLNCGEAYANLIDAYEEDLITDEDITNAAVKLYAIRVMLGEFEESRPYTDIPYSKLDCAEHKALNLKAAQKSLVLLKNTDFLPLNCDTDKKIAVIGPNAMSTIALEGNYNGRASEYITVADGVRKVFTNSKITVANGSPIWQEVLCSWNGFENLWSEGKAAASEADITVLCLGLDRTVEGEEIDVDNEFFYGGDKKTLRLPEPQMKLAEAVCEVCENVIVVVMCGSAVDLGEKLQNHSKAIIHAWYPGALGGLAIAQLIAGKFSPSGKLPLTFYKEDNTLHDFCSYDIKGRTYRYFDGTPLYPFGFGLGYAPFSYENFEVASCDADTIKVAVTLKNEGNMRATEKVQIYASFTDSRTTTPYCQLCGIEVVELTANETKTVNISIDKFWIKAVLEDGQRVDPNGEITLFAGGHQPDSLSDTLSGYPCKEIKLK